MSKRPHSATVGSTLRALRTEHRLTATDLAAQVGVSRITVARWERDKSLPQIEVCHQVVAAAARYDVRAADQLAALLGLAPAAPASSPPVASAKESIAVFEESVALVSDLADLPPQRVRAAFTQLVTRLAEGRVDLEVLVAELARQRRGGS